MSSYLMRIALLAVIAGLTACSMEPPPTPPYALQVKMRADSLTFADAYWPGFSTENVPLYLHMNGDSWLVNHPNPPNGWEPVPGWSELYHSNAIIPPAETSQPIKLAGTLTALVHDGNEKPDSLNGHIGQYISQSFRMFSQTHYPEWAPYAGDAFRLAFDDKELLTWQLLESEGLQEAAKALSKDELEEALDWMAMAATARDSFNITAPELDREYVRTRELEHGLPLYMDRRARGDDPQRLFRNDMWSDVTEVHKRVEVNAAVKAFLMDKIYTEWKTTISRDELAQLDLNEPFKATISRHSVSRSPVGSELVHEYERRAGQSIQRFYAERRSMLRRWDREPGYKVVVNAANYPLIVTGYDLSAVIPLTDSRLFHENGLKLRNNNGVVEISSQRILTIPAGDHPLFGGIERLEVVGLSGPPVAEERGDSLIVRWKDGEIRFKDAQLEDREGVMTITL